MLSKKAEEKLKAWLGPQSWDSNHDDDIRRFHAFVEQCARDGLTELLHYEFLEQANAIVEGFAPNEELKKIFYEYKDRANHILYFLEHTGRF